MLWQHEAVRAPAETEVQRVVTCSWPACRRLFGVCSACDGDGGSRVYCSRDCAAHARRRSVREAGRTYQRTDRGKAHHAARQARYRERQALREDVIERAEEPVREPTAYRPGEPVAEDHVAECVPEQGAVAAATSPPDPSAPKAQTASRAPGSKASQFSSSARGSHPAGALQHVMAPVAARALLLQVQAPHEPVRNTRRAPNPLALCRFCGRAGVWHSYKSLAQRRGRRTRPASTGPPH